MRGVALVTLVLAAMVLLTGAVALQSASSGAGFAVTVTSTDSAVLKLEPGTGPGNPAQNAYLSGGVLVLDFRWGTVPGTTYGFPARRQKLPPDKFRYRGLFRVTNNSGASRCIRVFVPGGQVDDLAGIYLRQPGDVGTGLQVAGPGGADLGTCQAVAPGGSVLVDFWWEIVSTRSNTVAFQVAVSSDP